MVRALVLIIALVAADAADPEPEPGYELRVDPERAEHAPGDSGAVSLSIVPRAGYRIDRDGALVVRVAAEPAGGLELPRTRYDRRHAADARADAPRFDVRYRAVAEGGYELRMDARFWLCRTHTCWPVRAERRAAIAVRAPAPPPDAGPTPPPTSP